mmetsp:Transcript_7734/g.22731  ORF Transcript_7734/g.22731 Transcript_7734/m.22731 type:complete len:99 (-) Transcript_7734:68-364(-)
MSCPDVLAPGIDPIDTLLLYVHNAAFLSLFVYSSFATRQAVWVRPKKTVERGNVRLECGELLIQSARLLFPSFAVFNYFNKTLGGVLPLAGKKWRKRR